MQKYIHLIILFLVLLAVSVTGLYYVVRREPQVNTAELSLSIEAPVNITSGDEAVFLVKYQNATRIPLTDAELFFRYPEGAVPSENPSQLVATVHLGNIPADGTETMEFRARIIGQKNDPVHASAELNYKTAGVSSFRKTAEATGRISDVAFFLNFNVPQRAVSGERIVYFLDYTNLSSNAYANTAIRMQYPDGFAYAGAEPAPTEDENIWDIGEVPGGGRGRISVSGMLTGTEGDTKKVKATIGFMQEGKFFPYAANSFDTVISAAPLTVSIELEEPKEPVAQRGDSLLMRIKYRNNTEVPIKDAVLRAELQGDMFSSKQLAAERGFFDSIRNTVIWTPANVKELLYLNPGREQQVTLRVNLKEQFSIKAQTDTNFTARIVATLESINVPPYLALNKISVSDVLDVKLETEPELGISAFYQDYSANIINTGPLPPQVNQETRYTIHWRISVPANDIENVEVRATLPTGVVPTGDTESRYTDAKPTFNETTGEVVWFIPRILANTGVLYPAFETVFQVALTPSVTQIGQTVELIRPSVLTAVDAFTGRTITAEAQTLRTNNVADIADGQKMGNVVP